MLRALCVAMTILVLPFESASADAGPNLGANAALKYWQAFATLPRFTDAEQKKLNAAAEHLTMPLDAQTREIVTKASYALQMMHRAASLPRCDFGSAYEVGVEIQLPHGPAARMLASLACLRARLRFQEGQSAEAIDDVVAAMKLGRHVSRDGVNIMLLAGYGIEYRAGETLALFLPKLDAATIKDLKTRLDALPPSGNPAATLQKEEKWALGWFERKVKEAKDKESLLAFLSQATDSEEKGRDPAERGRAFLEGCGGTAAGVLKCTEETRACYELMAKKLDLPLDQVLKEWEPEEMKRAGNPVFKAVFPALAKVRWFQWRIDVHRALLSAALDVQLDGRDALKNHPDPVVGGLFEYVAFEGGFELRSKFKADEKSRSKWKLDERYAQPVTLTVGVRGK